MRSFQFWSSLGLESITAHEARPSFEAVAGSLAMVKEMSFAYDHDALFDFMTQHILADDYVDRRYLSKAVREYKRRRGLRGLVSSILTGANPATNEEYKSLTDTAMGRATIVAIAPHDQKHQVATRMMKDFYFDDL